VFIDNDLNAALQTETTLRLSTLMLAEFNLNDLENVERIGNYFYRPSGLDMTWPVLTDTYFPDDAAFTGSDLSYEEYKVTEDPNPFVVVDKSPSYYYSLGDCILPFRPRSGINKSRFFSGKYIDNIRSGDRPRYYISSRYDYFKYWSSYRKDGLKERGISTAFVTASTAYMIDDAVPFVVYSQPVNANRLVVKMQTNVGTVDLGTVRTIDDEYIDDPLYDYEYASVPKHWQIQVLAPDDTWVDAASFTHLSTRSDSSPIVPKDGMVELFYGIKPPVGYIDTFDFLGYIDVTMLPTSGNLVGDAYIHGSSTAAAGTLVVWDGATWGTETLQYGWSLLEDVHIKRNGNATTLIDPPYYTSGPDTIYREFQRIRGMRIVVSTMNAPQTCFDLIEMSPRLSVDLSDSVTEFSVTKPLSGAANGLPVGSLATSNGAISLANVGNAFNEANTFDGINGSIIASCLKQNIKFVPYEIILDINGYNKYIPIKTLYADRFLSAVDGTQDVNIPLRDLFFRLETTNSPSVLYKDTRLTYAVASLLDSIGFSNYIFRFANTSDDVILPYFFVEKRTSIAEILERLAIATQSAMFFDEYNNFVVMSKEYLLPDEGERTVDFVLSGNATPLANIESIDPQESIVLNSGTIGYTIRYVQREVAAVGQTASLDSERSYRYKPVLLWEVSANQETKTINEASKQASGFALGAMALNANLTASVPYVVSNALTNNVIDFGESVYWLPRFQGYLYANGEIIRFDAVEYAIPGTSTPVAWVTSNQEYQRYFANLPFNGKIYPTGRVRIYAEPFYEVSASVTYMKNGPVKAHGRGQFDTVVTEHLAGLNDYWSDDANTYGIKMYSAGMFSTTPTEDLVPPTLSGTIRTETAAINTIAKKSSRNGIIKNFLASKVYEDGAVNKLKTTNAGTIQSSALVMRGPRPDPAIPNPRDLVSYVYKDLSGNSAFKHFGTRMRIIGKADQNFGQVANGSSNYYSIQAQSAEDSVSVNGGSGGIGIMVDPSNGSGYYFEIAALSDSNIEKYAALTDANGQETVVHNIIFYKVNRYTNSGDGATAPAMPQKLWGGLTNIIVDSGLFVGQDRLAQTDNNTVYDLSIEYEVLSSGAINFYLFINNILVKVVKDVNPLPVLTSCALFVRASTECMFENIYAIEDIVARNQGSVLADVDDAFDSTGVNTNEFMKKYAISGMVQSAYLTNISSSNPLNVKLYFEEFGTIMREAVHFSIDYDQAYPAFYSKIAQTFTTDRSFTVSGFYGGAYEAEFLVFNSADRAIVLDETSGSYLRILGVTFTQNSVNSMTVDDYYNKISDASDPQFDNNYLISPVNSKNDFNRIKASRSKYGERQFSMDSMYVQSEDQARNLMEWLINKTLKPRQVLVVRTFPLPTLQVGDIVTIEYTTPDNVEVIDPAARFVIKEIEYSRKLGSVEQVLKVVEV
jgi:hypothetical protein